MVISNLKAKFEICAPWIFVLVSNAFVYFLLSTQGFDRSLLVYEYLLLLLFLKYYRVVPLIYLVLLIWDVVHHVSPALYYNAKTPLRLLTDSWAVSPLFTLITVMSLILIYFLLKSVYGLTSLYKFKKLPQVTLAAMTILTVFFVDSFIFSRTFNTYARSTVTSSVSGRLDAFNINPGSSLIVTWIVGLARDHLIEDQYSKVVPKKVKSAVNHVETLNYTSAVDKPHVVLIVFESLGELISNNMTDSFDYPVDELSNRYRLEFGHTPYFGGTPEGEIRELCESNTSYKLLTGAQLTDTCLPKLVGNAGYNTIAIHGFKGIVFDRFDWYKSIGFKKSIFLEQMNALGLKKRCGSIFRGGCDTEIAEYIENLLRSSDPVFVHWTTLNTHFPIAVGDLSFGDADQCRNDQVMGYEYCMYRVVVRNTLDSIFSIAKSTNIKDTIFIIVGDHAPRFISKDKRDMYSSQYVPYVKLIPRR